MKLLLDTNVFLWYLADAKPLSKALRSTIAEADEVFVSAASIWEIAIKSALGKLDVKPTLAVDGIAASGFAELAIRASHAAAVSGLPPIHRDPFDRLLVAQAITEPLRLVTADATLERYPALVQVVGRS